MVNVSTLLKSCRQAHETLKQPYHHHGALDCTRTFCILPLRYAVVGGALGLRSQLPELPEHLRAPYQVGALDSASYALRPLREGFLYVLEKRKLSGEYHWQVPYRVQDDGILIPWPVDEPYTPAPPPLDPLAAIRSTQRLLTVHDLDDLENLRLFFSPDRLTPAALRNLERRRSSVPALNIGKFAAPYCPPPEPNVLSHDQLDRVADFAAESDPAIRRLLKQQLFDTPYSLSKMAVARALAPHPEHVGPGKLNPRGIAIVVEDAIGITQELNAWRNSGLEMLKEWLDAKSPTGQTNEHKLLVAQAFTQLHEQFSERKVAIAVGRRVNAAHEHMNAMHVPYSVDQQQWQHTKEAVAEASGEQIRAKLQARADSGEYARLFENKYLPLVDYPAMQHQLTAFENKCKEAQRHAELRANDHLKWLQHPQLIDALKAYDPNDLISGLAFAHQTGLCVMGMEAVKAGADLMQQWWRADEPEPGNLALRALVYNQKSTHEVLKSTLHKLRLVNTEEDELKQLETALKHGKELAAEFGRIDSQLDALAQHGHVNTAGALVWVGNLGREALRAGGANTIDRMIHRRLSTYLAASMGEQAVNLRLAESHTLKRTDSPSAIAHGVKMRLH